MRRRLAGWVALLVLGTALFPVSATAELPVAAEMPAIAITVDGAEMTGFAMGGEIAMEQAYGWSGACTETGACVSELKAELEMLESTAAGVTDKARHDSAMSAIRNMKDLVKVLEDTVDTGDLDGDGMLDRTYRPGRPVFGNITLERAVSAEKSLSTWYQEAAKGKNIRKSISVIFRDRGGAEVARYTLFDCFPTRYSVVQGESGPRERIALAYEGLERQAVPTRGGKKASDTKGTVLLSAGGADLGAFRSVSAAVGFTDRDDDCDGLDSCKSNPVHCADGSCVADLLALLDDVEFQADGMTDAYRHDIAKNAIGNIRARVRELDPNLEGAVRRRMPGRTSYQPITMERELSSDPTLSQWVLETAKGAPWRKSGSMIYLGSDGMEVARFALGNIGPTRYTVKVKDQHMVEEIEFVIERIERQ